jgi:hypothetical protein
MKTTAFIFRIIVTLIVHEYLIAQDFKNAIFRETDQLIQAIRVLRDPSFQGKRITEGVDNKCGFTTCAAVYAQWRNLSIEQQKQIAKIQSTSASQKNKIIGNFRIIYDTTGINEPALLEKLHGDTLRRIPNSAEAFVDSVGRIFNDVYIREVNELGYSAPPFQFGESYYCVVISNSSDYGMTWPQDTLSPFPGGQTPRYTSYIEIHNDFKDFYTTGMDGLKVTAAHEFNHMIQIGSYGCTFLESGEILDSYAYELTSTWMEDVLYPDINDYLNYLDKYFVNGFNNGYSFNSNTSAGYERCIWAHYLTARYGIDVIKEIWTSMRQEYFLESNSVVLVNRGSSLQNEFAEFTRWNYFTADRTVRGMFYPEGEYYPRFKPTQQIGYNNTTSTMFGNVNVLSSSMYAFGVGSDTITAIVANVDVEAAKRRESATRRVDVILTSQSLASPYILLKNGLKGKINVADTSFWRYYFSRESIQGDAAPNPFNISYDQFLVLPMGEDLSKYAEVSFYNSAMDLAYSGQINLSYHLKGLRVLEIPNSSLQSKLSSGIYFVFAKTATNTYSWKIAVIR